MCNTCLMIDMQFDCAHINFDTCCSLQKTLITGILFRKISKDYPSVISIVNSHMLHAVECPNNTGHSFVISAFHTLYQYRGISQKMLIFVVSSGII